MTFPAHIASVPNSLRAVQTIVRGFVRSYGRQRMVLRSSVAPCARTGSLVAANDVTAASVSN
jgi:hypothetical protein